MILDLRHEQKPDGPDQRCGKIRGGSLVMRDPASIDAICLHQTAVSFGASASSIAAAKGDKDLARHRRALGVHAHVTAFRDGTVVPAYPLRAYVWHGNGANQRSIGLEIEGLYNGKPGGSNAEPDQTTIEGAREAMRWIVDTALAEGIHLQHVVAHRQYSRTRQADPGWTIWREVALWAESTLGLRTIPALAVDGGRPIPTSWDPRQSATY